MEISELLKGLVGIDVEVLEGVVTNVDKDAFTVDVMMQEGVEFFDIKLRAVSNGGKAGLVCLPQKDSEIVFAKVRGEADYVIISSSELDEVLVEIESTKLIITKDGIEISRGGESLSTLIKDLLNAILKLTVTTPSGVSGIPVNSAEFQSILSRVSMLLK